MGQNYYEHPNRNLPDVVQCHVDSLVVYMASILFPQEFLNNPQAAYNRVLISDVNAGTNVSLGDAIEYFRQMNDNLPFVAYNVGDPQPSSWGNIAPVSTAGLLYCEELNAYIRAYPMELELDFVAFFGDALDQRRAYTILGSESSAITRLFTPVLFDDIEVKLPIDLNYDFSKGSLSGEFEQAFLGRIWDIIFKITIRYYEYIIDEVPTPDSINIKDETGLYPSQARVAPVENIILRLFSQYGAKVNDSILLDQKESLDPLKIISVTPKNNAKNITTSSLIELDLNRSVNPNSVIDSIEVNPDFEKTIYYNNDYTKIIIKNTAVSGLQSYTTYEVEVKQSLIDGNDISLESDYKFSFKTQ